jgi:antitoxin component of RelBE/YafQ-DinJ toxin-antitoxin module
MYYIRITKCITRCITKGERKMSLLKKHAAKPKKAEKSEVVTVRLPSVLLNDFQNYCKELNLSVSKAVRLLIKYELIRQEQNQNLKEEPKQVLKQEQKKEITPEKIKFPEVNVQEKKAEVKKRVGVGKRFTTKHWEVDNELPCPICKNGKWMSQSNIDRHFKKDHGTSRRAIFSDARYIEIADEMFDKRLGGNNQ